MRGVRGMQGVSMLGMICQAGCCTYGKVVLLCMGSACARLAGEWLVLLVVQACLHGLLLPGGMSCARLRLMMMRGMTGHQHGRLDGPCRARQHSAWGHCVLSLLHC